MTSAGPASAAVFCVTRIGDLVLATVTFDALVARYGPIHLVTSTLVDGLVDEDERVERVTVLRHPGGLRGRAAILRHLRDARRRGAVVVNLEVFRPRWRFLRRSVGLLGLEARHLDLDAYKAAERSGSTRHAADFYADVVGLTPAPSPSLRPGARADAEAGRILGDTASPLVMVHPGSHGGWTAKRPPSTLMIEVVRRVAAERSACVALVGGRNERELCAGILDAAGVGSRGLNLAGALPLRALPAVLRRADVFLGGDSGPLKIAEAVGTPTVSLWTVTDPARLAPRGTEHVAFTVGPGRPSARAVADALLGLLPPAGDGP